jgi:cytochrome c peroxidase
VKQCLLLVILALAACPRGKDNKTIEPGQKKDGGAHVLDDGSAAAGVLPPAPPLPEMPRGLPPIQVTATPDAVALGDALFHEPRLATTGKLACAGCHDPAHGFSGTRQPTAAGQLNLRRTPALVNLAWRKTYGWDGRYASLDEQLAAHLAGQLGDAAAAVQVLAADPTYHAYFERAGAGASPQTLLAALAAYALTRYDGDAPWDRAEHGGPPPADLKAGYQLFTGKAQCAVCHPPPLYTDLGFHRLGLIASHDEGRGRVDPAQAGAFATPTLRGAASRTAFFHDASAATLDAAIDWHLAGGTGQGADASIIDPALKKVTLSASEREQLGAFVRALTRDQP